MSQLTPQSYIIFTKRPNDLHSLTMLQYRGSPRYLRRDNKSIPPFQLIVEKAAIERIQTNARFRSVEREQARASLSYVTCLIAKTFVLAFQPSLPTHP